jgi:hypothetical protein
VYCFATTNRCARAVFQALATGMGYFQIIGLIFVFAGTKVFETLGLPVPEWQRWLNDNMAMAAVGVFLLSSFGSKLRTSGAFEVSIDGHLVSSKLTTGRVISIEVCREQFCPYPTSGVSPLVSRGVPGHG